jgi:thiamine biosynthesis lipoprotein
MNNNGKGIYAVLHYLLIVVFMLSFSCAKEKPFVKETYVMGTVAWVTIYGLGDEEAEAAAGDAVRELHRVESMMSNWKRNSEISRLNRESDGKPYNISRELYHVIERSLHYSRVTSGAFDITSRPIVQLWGFQGGSAHLPSEAEIAEALQRVGYRKIMLDGESTSIIMPPAMELDLAGIAKGYGVDRAVIMLKNHGVERALVNLGGNIYALGTPPGEKGWPVGIRDPRGGRSVAGSLLLVDEAVATSGNYENYVEIEGAIYGHIIDPRAGRPVSHVLSVTVVAPTALEADALSTGLFVLGPESGERTISQLEGINALFAIPNGKSVVYKKIGDFSGSLALEAEP